MQLYFVVDHVVYLTCHIHFLGIQFALNTQVYTVKMQVIRVIFHGGKALHITTSNI